MTTEYINRTKGHLTKTKINAGLLCWRSFGYAYVDEIPGKMGHKAASGIALHDALEQHNKCKLAGESSPWRGSAGVDLFVEKWKARLEEFEPEDDFDDPRMHVANLWPVYMQKHDPEIEPVEVEQQIIFDVDGIKCMTHIDLIRRVPGDKLVVVDYKFTGKKRKIEHDLGAPMYAQATGIRLSQLYLWLRKRVPEIATSTMVVEDHHLKVMRHLIRQTAQMSNGKVFPYADPGHWKCSKRWCSYWDRCRGNKLGPRFLKNEEI